MFNRTQYREDPYNMMEQQNSLMSKSYLDNYHSGPNQGRSLLSQVHRLRKASGTPKRTIPSVQKSKGLKNFAQPTASSKQKLTKDTSAKHIVSLS